MTISEKLWALINSHGITRAELSKSINVPYTSIDSLLRRENFDNIKLSTIKAICAYFNVSMDYLLGDEVVTPPNKSISLSEESIEVALAYEKADYKDRNIVRCALDLPSSEENAVKPSRKSAM